MIEECDGNALVPSPSGIAITTRQPAVFRERDLQDMASTSPMARYLLGRRWKSLCCMPLLSHNQAFGALNVGRQRDDAFVPEDVELLNQVAQQIAIAVENGLAYREIADLKEKLSKEKLYLEEEIKTDYDFEDIVGSSAALKRVLKQVEIVAPTDSTVLILGETGTGKGVDGARHP